MNEIKVRLNMRVQGAQLLSSQECEENPTENYELNQLTIECYKKNIHKSKKPVKEILNYRTRKNRLVTHNLNICKEAYDYMLSTPTDPKYTKSVKGSNKKVWDTMPVKERLKKHFDLIANDFCAKSYTFEILED